MLNLTRQRSILSGSTELSMQIEANPYDRNLDEVLIKGSIIRKNCRLNAIDEKKSWKIFLTFSTAFIPLPFKGCVES